MLVDVNIGFELSPGSDNKNCGFFGRQSVVIRDIEYLNYCPANTIRFLWLSPSEASE